MVKVQGSYRALITLDWRQVFYLDFETTDLIYEKRLDLPWIIQFTVKTAHNKIFNTMITPKDNDDFDIPSGATEVHGWTKDELLSLPIEERPNIKDAWISFLAWAEETKVLKDEPIVLCAYNGFGFDFRLLIHNLRYFNY